jgi:hypothetical protein
MIMPKVPIEASINSILEAIDAHRAAINANWNGENPDLMDPEDLANIADAIAAAAQDYTKLAFAFGGIRSPV